MNNTYEWLFDNYALPKLKNIEKGYIEILDALAERLSLSKIERLRLHDIISNMRLDWGAEVFALGVRFGMRLSAPRGPSRDCRWLLEFLP